jgi:Spy/CpxP family protein refolding chaperone
VKCLTFLAGVFLAVAASAPAQAQPGGRERTWGAERQQQREFRRDENLQRRQQDRMTGEQRRPGRLTPEERQQLRRDIREHGRDVYRDHPRRF